MLIIDRKPESITSEAYRTLRTNIQYSSFDKDIQCIVVTSSEPGEGKSTTSSNLALSMISDGKKTLIIDCDLRKPKIHKCFQLTNVGGLSEVLLGKEKLENVVKEYKGLHILTSGKIPPNPAEMLGSSSMENLLQELRQTYDFIILDTPPVLAVTDSQILSTKADGTILVIRASRTKKETVSYAKKYLDKVNANVIGTILNGVETSLNKYYYYYG